MGEHVTTTKQRLYPEPGVLADEEGIYQDIDLPAPTSPTLPYVLLNMVGSVDGRSSVGGKASGIGGRADREAMRALRARVDAVMVGAGTLRAEKINLGLDDPGAGQPLAGQPLAVVVGGCGDIPITGRLVGGRQPLIIAVPEGSPNTMAASRDLATVVRIPSGGGGRANLRWLLEFLRSEHAVSRLLVEGGPTLNRALIEEQLVDELFLTVAPRLLLGSEAAIVSGGPGGEPSRLTLLTVHSADDELFLRYRVENRD